MTMTCDSWDSNSHTDFLPHLAFSKGGELNMNPVYWYIKRIYYIHRLILIINR